MKDTKEIACKVTHLRQWVVGAATACCLSLSWGPFAGSEAAEMQATPEGQHARPNILFIMSDDHALRAISAYGNSLIGTPNIDRIAKEGILFRNAFVTNSLCAPSRAVLLTGKFSHLNGLRDNGDTFNGHQQTLPKLLRQAGYETAVIGKWHLKSDPVGFDTWKVLIGQGEYYSPRFKSANGVTQYDGDYVTDKITDLAIDTLEGRDKSKPFMMLYHHKAPHRNWMPPVEGLDLDAVAKVEPPETFDDTFEGRPAAAQADASVKDMFLSYDMKLQPGAFDNETGTGGGRDQAGSLALATEAWRADYARLTPEQREKWDAFYDVINAEYQAVKDDPAALARWKFQRYMQDYMAVVRSLDDNVGRILDYLDETGLAENTIVVYTSDQGFYLGEHGWYDKRFMYEESMRTPLAIRYPAYVEAGREVRELVQNIDYAPTFLDFAGVEVPQDMQGASIRGLMAGQQAGAWREGVYYHYYAFPAWHSVRRHYGVRTNRYKLIHFYGDIDHWELFDLEADPTEQHNLYGDPSYADVQIRLRQQLTALRHQYGVTDGVEGDEPS